MKRRRLVLLGTVLLLSVLPHQALTAPAWNGRDTLPITRWLVLSPVGLTDVQGRPLISPTSDPDSGARFMRFLFDDYVREEQYVLGSRKAGDRYTHAHWKEPVWDTLSADSSLACRIDLRHPGSSANALSFAIAEFTSAKTDTALLEYSVDDGALIWLNGEALVCLTGNRDLSKPGFANERPVRLLKGANRIVFKLDNRDGPFGVRLRVRPWISAERPVIKKPLSPAERLKVIDAGKKVPSLRAPDPAAVRAVPGAQDSLARIADHLFTGLPKEYDTWLLTRNRRYGLSFMTSVLSLEQAARSIKERQNPLPRMRGPVAWAYWSDMTGSVVPFHAYIPEGYSPSKKWPLLVVLHGASGISFQNLEFLAYGTFKPPADMIILSPSGRGSNGYYGPGEHDILDLLRLMKKSFAIDSNRVILSGTSMGGMGTLRHLSVNGDLFSCGAPFCGFAVPATAFSIANRPLWTFHGDLDRSVPWLFSAQLEQLISKTKGTLRFTTFKGAGHAIGEDGYSDSLLRWMVAQKRPDLPPRIALSGWELRPARMGWLEYRAPLRTLNNYRLTAERKLDRIVVSTANVQSFAITDPRILTGVMLLDIDGRSLPLVLPAAGAPLNLVLSPSGDWALATGAPRGRAFNFGGVRSLLNRPLTCVYSTRDPGKTGLCRAVAERVAFVEFGGFPVLADTAFTPAAAVGRNLFFSAASLSDSLSGIARAASLVPLDINDSFALAGEGRHLLLHAPLPDTAAEIGLFVAGDRVNANALAAFDLYRNGHRDAVIFDSNLAAENCWFLRQDWTPAVPDPRLTLDAPTPEALARAIAEGLRKSLQVEAGLMIIDPTTRVTGTRVTNFMLKELLGEEGPVVLELKGRDLLALLDSPGLKRPRQKVPLKAYVTGVSRDKIKADRTYAVAATTRAFYYTTDARIRLSLPESAFDLF